jgi:hypothetical protein
VTFSGTLLDEDAREGSNEAYVRVAATGLAVRIAFCRPSKGFSHGRG